MVHISHGRLLAEALARDSDEEVVFHEIKDEEYEHRSAPTYLCSPEGMEVLTRFLTQVHEQTKKGDIQQKSTQKLK